MCKVWPGLRCSDHPQQKLQKLGVALHQAEENLSYLEENKKLIRKKDGTTGAKTLTPEEAQKSLQETQNKISSLKTRIDIEQCGYAMSAGGRKYYQDIVNNPENSYNQRLEAATILHAALDRINTQKDIGQVLKDETITDKEKDIYLHLQETEQDKNIQSLEQETEQVARQQAENRQQAQNTTNPQEKAKLAKEQQELLAKQGTLREKLKQRKALKAEIAKHRAARRQQIEKKFDNLAVRVGKIFDFFLWPLNLINNMGTTPARR